MKRSVIIVVLTATLVLHLLPVSALNITIDYGSMSYSETGLWNTNTAMSGADGSSVRFSTQYKSTAMWKPSIVAGSYKISVYKTATSFGTTQEYIINHNNREQRRTINFSEGRSGWVSLGVFEFSGKTEEYVAVEKQWQDAMRPLYADAVRFEDVNLSNKEEGSFTSLGTEVIITNGDADYAESGVWANSSLMGYGGKVTRYTSAVGSHVTWKPLIEPGNYDVYVYKIPYGNNTTQVYTITHAGRTDTASVDFITGSAGWTLLGTYEFDGDGEEYVRMEKTDETSTAWRASAMRFAPHNPAPPPKVVVESTPVEETESTETKLIEGATTEGAPLVFSHDDAVLSGPWGASGLLGFSGTPTKYVTRAGVGASATWEYTLMPAFFRISVYRVVHLDSGVAKYEVKHNGETEVFMVDCSSGESGWYTLGDFEFDAAGDEHIQLSEGKVGSGSLRVSGIQLEYLNVPGRDMPKFDALPVNLHVYGENIDARPVKEGDVVLAEAETLLTAMGAEVTREGNKLTAVRRDVTLEIDADNNVMYKNSAAVELPAPLSVRDGAIFVPVRAAAENLGGEVEWDSMRRTVNVKAYKPVNFYIAPTDFNPLGTWKTDSTMSGGFRDFNLIGLSMAGDALPASAQLDVEQAGKYYFWARSYDVNPTKNDRLFRLRVEGTEMTFDFGGHGAGGWKWENGGAVELKEGLTSVELLDISKNYVRVNCLFITNDPTQEPPASYEDVLNMFPHNKTYPPELQYPAHAKTTATPKSEYTLEGSGIRYTFYEVATENGVIIQNSAQILRGDEWVNVTERSDYTSAHLLLYAQSSRRVGGIGQFPLWEQKYMTGGKPNNVVTPDIFGAGEPIWMVPDSIRKINETTYELTAKSAVARLTSTWTLDKNGKEPKVKLKLTALADGAFSLGMFSGKEHSMDQVSSIITPYRISGRALTDDPYLLTEEQLMTPVSIMTVGNGDDALTYAVAAEAVPNGDDWPRMNTAKFGVSVRGIEGGALPAMFAPVFGNPGAEMQNGDTTEFAYRPIIRRSDWFDVYAYVVSEIVGLRDYRSNYYSSLNEAIDNTRKLLKDDSFGWDPIAKSYYNIEGRNVTSNASPLTMLQAYLLTEDMEILEKRAIPTIENMLTRKTFHYSSGDTSVFNASAAVESQIGSPVREFGNDIFGGAYMMTRGLTPVLKDIGMDSGYKSSAIAPEFAEWCWLYTFTGNAEYLDKAKALADKYIDESIDTPRERVIADALFIALDSYADFGALLDLYEVCGDEKYLEAAVKAARVALTTVFTGPTPLQGDYVVTAEETRNTHFMKGHAMPWWSGEYVLRRGYPDLLEKLQDKTVPQWVVSRVGLSIEQTSTFRQHNSSPIIMANWAPDLMRLARHTGEKIFADYARNAVIGRHTNYPGYYLPYRSVEQMKPDYPIVGPDITGLYYHHLPPFMAMLEDFIVAQAETWSNGAITFPYVRNQGYAYFKNRSYGFAPGKFYDLNDMWLWIDDGLAKPDNRQIDYIAARKDGMTAFAFMNESDQNVTSNITLSLASTGGVPYSGSAVLYSADGVKSSDEITNNVLTMTVPAHDLVGIAFNTRVNSPAFATVDYSKNYDVSTDNAMVNPQDNSEGVGGAIIQFAPEFYHAYVYMTTVPEGVNAVTLNYQIGDSEWRRVPLERYPFEYTVRIDQPAAEFKYYFETVNGVGKQFTLKGLLKNGTLAR